MKSKTEVKTVKKRPTKKVEVEKESPERYLEAVGRRKESIARVRLFTKKANDKFPEDKGLISVNQKPYQEYFRDLFLQDAVEEPLRKLKSLDRFKGLVKVEGGGLSGQAEAIRLGISRALVLFDANYRKKLKKFGYLTQDSRIKERRKYGLKKARKAPQWAKR
ncbi:MAG: 30S ribosomal protein S9 [Parcubacteria group bacterium]|nr:30S ribosomal protein S9 [Parcubacteria group bacterium]